MAYGPNAPDFRRVNRRNLTSFSSSLPKPRAMVIDEDFDVRMMEWGLIVLQGIVTDAVESTIEALGLIASGTYYDLILIEKNMPMLNGLETVRMIRSWGIRSKIVGLVEVYNESERAAFLAAGADLCSDRELLPDVLITALEQLYD